MGFSGQDQLISALTAGQYLRRDMSKLTAPVHTAGGWHFLAGLGGYPNASTFPATVDLVWMNCSELIGEGTTILGIQHGGNPGGSMTKHLLNIGAMMVAAAGAPWQAKLVDLQGYYRMSGVNVTQATTRTLINSNTVTFSSSTGLLATYTNDFMTGTKVRYSNSGGSLPTGISALTDYWITRFSATTCKMSTSFSNMIAGTFVPWTDNGAPTTTMRIEMPRYAQGAGCEAFFVAQTQPTAGGPTLSASAYDNTTDTPGAGARAFQGSVIMNATADAYATRILHSGNAAGKYGPFMPRQGGDLGIARINSFNWSAGTAYTGSGVVALCIARPLCDIALPVTGMWSERDLVNQLMSMPKVEDGACLMWMLFGTGATTTNSPFNAAIDFGWN
jgi:hypothetical protein